MKKIIIILSILLTVCTFAFASDTQPKTNKGLSIGADIGLLNQGVSLRYDAGRWFDLDFSFRLPISMYVIEGIESLKDKSQFDLYTILSPELSVTGYLIPIKARCFSLGLGVNGTAFAATNGPWIEKKGEPEETQHNAGTFLGVYLKAAVKLQFDFNKWGFNIAGFYPIIGTGKDFGEVHLGNALTSIISMIYNSVRVGFDFKM